MIRAFGMMLLAAMVALGPSTAGGQGNIRRAAQKAAAARAALRQKQQAELREEQRLRAIAAADIGRHAYASAARAYASLLQLRPGDPAVESALAAVLAQARLASCTDAAWSLASQQHFGPAADQLATCGAAGTQAQWLRQLATAADALQHGDWSAGAAAMRSLPTTPLPPALAGTLAPAMVRFGAGDARGAAMLARMRPRQPGDAAATALATQFALFLRNRFLLKLLRVSTLPALAGYLMLLAGSLFWGLRRALCPTAATEPV